MSVPPNVWGIRTARHSGKIMDIAGGSFEPGAPLRQWEPLPEHPNQRFRFERLNNGYYRIRVMRTNKFSTCPGARPVAARRWCRGIGTVATTSGSPLEDAAEGFYLIRAKHSGKYLDVSRARTRQWSARHSVGPHWRSQPALASRSSDRQIP